jgi:hypothetical protein
MAVSCGANIVKYFFFFLNFTFVLCGIYAIYYGLNTRSAIPDDDQSQDALKVLFTYSNLAIAAGILVTLVTFFGCYGTLCEYFGMLIFYEKAQKINNFNSLLSLLLFFST